MNRLNPTSYTPQSRKDCLFIAALYLFWIVIGVITELLLLMVYEGKI